MPFIGEYQWNGDDMLREFHVINTGSRLVVIRKWDGVLGTLEYAGTPPTFFNFQRAPR